MASDCQHTLDSCWTVQSRTQAYALMTCTAHNTDSDLVPTAVLLTPASQSTSVCEKMLRMCDRTCPCPVIKHVALWQPYKARPSQGNHGIHQPRGRLGDWGHCRKWLRPNLVGLGVVEDVHGGVHPSRRHLLQLPQTQQRRCIAYSHNLRFHFKLSTRTQLLQLQLQLHLLGRA